MFILKLARHVEERGRLLSNILRKDDFERRSFSLYIIFIKREILYSFDLMSEKSLSEGQC